MLREDYDCRYHLMIGRSIRIKRQPFEKFIDKVEQI
ncbi:excisionase [Laedolimicola ammoniilytica]